ncbi:MAG TPA: hypothetical protein VIL51_02095, partial [Thermoleophilia bacterium]
MRPGRVTSLDNERASSGKSGRRVQLDPPPDDCRRDIRGRLGGAAWDQTAAGGDQVMWTDVP